MSVQQFWNLFQLLGVFTCHKLTNLCQNFITETCKQRSKTTRHKLCCEKLGTVLAMMLKALPLVHFWSVLLLKEQMMTSVRKTLKMLVRSGENRSISSKICPENNKQNPPFFYLLLSGQVYPENSRKVGQFFLDFVPKNPTKFDFFSATYQKPCISWLSQWPKHM